MVNEFTRDCNELTWVSVLLISTGVVEPLLQVAPSFLSPDSLLSVLLVFLLVDRVFLAFASHLFSSALIGDSILLFVGSISGCVPAVDVGVRWDGSGGMIDSGVDFDFVAIFSVDIDNDRLSSALTDL